MLTLIPSLTDYQFGMPTFGFVGLQNYRAMLSNARFRNSLSNTLFYVGIVASLPRCRRPGAFLPSP